MHNDTAASFNELRDEIYADAIAHGLWSEGDDPTVCSWLVKNEAEELDEAADAWCESGWDEEENEEFAEELADVVIMCMSVAGHLGIDIGAAILRKVEINQGRAWKHGKEEAGR